MIRKGTPQKIKADTYGNHVFGGLELPESDIDGDTTLTLSLELVEHPGCDDASLRLHIGYGRLDVLTILEGTLAELSSLLFELLDGTLVDTTTLVDQVTSGGRLAGIDVADN